MKEQTESIQSPENSAKAFREELAKLEQQNTAEQITAPQSLEEVTEPTEEMQDSIPQNEEQAEQEATQEDSQDEEEDNKPHIPRKRLNKEIEKRRALEAQLQAEREEKIKYQTELDMYNRALEQLKSSEPQESNKELELDPLDSEAHRFYMRKIKELEEKLDGTTTKLTQSEQQKHFENVLNAQQIEFTKKNPDFSEAYNYLLNAEMENTKMFFDSPQEAQQAVLQRLAQASAIALQKNQNAAETLYKMAKNYGYNAKDKVSSASIPNLNAIESNMKKSRSIDDMPSVPLHPGSGSQNFTRLDNFERLMSKDGQGVDKNEFYKTLERIRKGV